jgi:hypothetical protein
MGAMGRVRFLKSNLFFSPIPFLSDFGGKGMGACSSINNHKTSGLLRGCHENFDPLKFFVYVLNIV